MGTVGCSYGVNACNSTVIAPPPIVQMPGANTSPFMQFLPVLAQMAGPAMNLFNSKNKSSNKNTSSDDESGDVNDSTSLTGGSYNHRFGVEGKMESCDGTLPPSVARALEEALAYRNGACKPMFDRLGSDKKIVINDYSQDATAYMYIFTAEGKCLHRTAVSYGVGSAEHPLHPVPCSDGRSNNTPPGFHLTEPHIGSSGFNCNNSLGLTGLEGQSTTSRGVLIHEAKTPGKASSLGCSGIGENVFHQVQQELGYGSLVYNYFGDTPKASNCRSNAGMGHDHYSCRTENGTNLTSNMCSGTGFDRAPSSVLSFRPDTSNGAK